MASGGQRSVATTWDISAQGADVSSAVQREYAYVVQSCSCASFFKCQHRSINYGASVMRMQPIWLVCQRWGRRFSCFSQQLKLQCSRSTVAVLWAAQMQRIERELQCRCCSGSDRVIGSGTEWQQQCRVEWQEAKLQQHRTSAQNHVMHKCEVLLEHTLDVKRECWDFVYLGSISCALAPKFCGGTRVHLIYKTQKKDLVDQAAERDLGNFIWFGRYLIN